VAVGVGLSADRLSRLARLHPSREISMIAARFSCPDAMTRIDTERQNTYNRFGYIDPYQYPPM
jgi:hypothetical protein